MYELEKLKASIRGKAEHAFRVIKQQFGFDNVSFKRLNKNAARLHMRFAMRNLWMVRKLIPERAYVPSVEWVCPLRGRGPGGGRKRPETGSK